MSDETQAPKPGILTVTAFHTDALDTYKFFIPYSENIHTEMCHIAAALAELAEFIREPQKLTTKVTEFSSVDSVTEAVAFWGENRPEGEDLDISVSHLVEEQADIWQLYHNLEEVIKFQLKRTAEPDSRAYSISQATFEDVIDVFQEFFDQHGVK